MNLLLTFTLINIANVIIQTIKSIATVKCKKGMAALVNAVAYGLYTIVTVFTLCELPLMLKAGIVAVANLIGVYMVKWGEERARKDKLWKVEVTIPAAQAKQMIEDCKYYKLAYNYVNIEKYFIFNFYCPTQKDSANVYKLLKSYDAKYFVSESKSLL